MKFTRPKPGQMEQFGWRLFYWDVIVVAGAIALNGFLHFWALPWIDPRFETAKDFRINLNPIALAIALFATWVVALATAKTWNSKLAGTGIPEYVMTTKASFRVVLAFAFAALLFKVDVSRLFVLTTFFTGTLMLMLHRWAGRQWLLRQRKQGTLLRRTALVGPADQVLSLAKKLAQDLNAGYLPVVASVSSRSDKDSQTRALEKMGIRIVSFDSLTANFFNDEQVASVIAIGSDEISAEALKHLGWELEGTSAQLIVAPALVDFAGNRLSTLAVSGMPFLHVETPRFEGLKYFVKSVFDFVFGLVALVFFLPIMLVAGIAIWLQDKRPILFKQERIGQRGEPFQMFKFRSMHINADSQHEQLSATASNQVNTKMFKDPNDARITKVGRFIRRWSIDELPQIFNVLNGTMSVVGPRPPLRSEVANYEEDALRRLLVKPGITGLWQVSGRSLLSWDETVRLDLYYVENWSIATDIFIVLRTVKAVFSRSGAF